MVTMVHMSHFWGSEPWRALVTDDMTCGIAYITTQVIPLIGGSETIIILVRTDNMSARQW